MGRKQSQQRSPQFRGSIHSSSVTLDDGLYPCPELEACELIIGVDFTKSNNWTGKQSFQGRCLHDLEGPPNPYVQVLDLIAQRLKHLDDDGAVPCYGFGDVASGRDKLFSFYNDNAPTPGLRALLERYKEIASVVNMSGPSTFAPLIRQAMKEVHNSGMKLHVLLILADGLVSKECLDDTKRAIADASHFPLSIVMIGVGDGPWEGMERIDNDEIEGCAWDNFQFVEFNKLNYAGNGNAAEGSNRPSFESVVIERIREHCKHALSLKGEVRDPHVSDIISKISNGIRIDPPTQ